MQNIYFKYLKKLLIFSLIIIGIEWGLSLIINPVWVSNAWWVTALFFVALDIITYRLVWKQIQKNVRKLITMFMLSTTIRLLLSLLVIVVYVLLNKTDAKAFILVFFINYIVFTLFETIEVLKLSKGKA